MSDYNVVKQLDNRKTSRTVNARLRFIEHRLFWEGTVNRADITQRFKVSVPQASNDLALYRKLAPSNIEYDTHAKRYVPSRDFVPLLQNISASRYLLELKAVADEVVPRAESWIGTLPEVAAMPLPGRHVESEILRELLETVRGQRSLRVLYHSMAGKNADPAWQWVTPHAFGSDGLRWHARAYCHQEERFKDFLLSRFLDLGEDGSPKIVGSQDADWFSFFDVVMVPNPRLEGGKQKTIAHEYEMKGGELVVPVRRALLYYFNKRLRLDLDSVDSPHEAPVVVRNRVPMDAAIAAATGVVVPALKA